MWEGKYDEFGNRREVDVAACAMPMQRIETVDEPRQRAAPRADRHVRAAASRRELAAGQRDDFRNRLIWGDNKLVMASLLKEFKGQIDLIYIDPPFDVGADFTMDVPIGDEKETVGKDQSTLEMVAYRDMWGKGTDSYLHMMFERLYADEGTALRDREHLCALRFTVDQYLRHFIMNARWMRLFGAEQTF